jgi:hypothetical protein
MASPQKIRPGAVIAIETFGDLLRFNPHRLVLITVGFQVFCGFRILPRKKEAKKT